ncbi:MAG: YqaE/Pmp3 family membrane protein [Gemmataceae bacterium]
MRSVLAVVCPPAAVLVAGARSELVANVALTCLFFLPGVVHALGVVDRTTTARQYSSVMRAMERAGA